MNKKIIILLVLGIIILAAAFILNNTKMPNNQIGGNGETISNQLAPQNTDKNQQVKEFSIDSFTEIIDGKPKPQFSLKEITVNKGDLVRIKIFVKNGKHDFKIDEFNVFADTPTGKETIVEFMADKVGEFVYYCNQPGHRAAGHWGTLKVIE